MQPGASAVGALINDSGGRCSGFVACGKVWPARSVSACRLLGWLVFELSARRSPLPWWGSTEPLRARPTDDHWRSVAAAIGRDDLAHFAFADLVERHDELEAAISACSSPQDRAEIEAELQALGVPARRVLYAPPDVVADPQLAHRNAFTAVAHDVWPEVMIEETNIHLSRTPGRARWAAPTVGEHLYPIHTEILGRSPDEAADLIAIGIFH